MKLISISCFSLLCAIFITSCGLDNYEEPKSSLLGKVVYNGQVIGVRGTSGAVQLQLYQDGYEKRDPIPVYVGQDGTYKASLFNGQYKLITKSGNGPWQSRQDTLLVDVSGTTTCDVSVTPYLLLTKESVSLSGNKVDASATLEKVVASSAASSLLLLVGKTAFVDEGTYIARQEVKNPEAGMVSLSLDLKENKEAASAKILYARIGVKATEADQYIYTPVIKIR